MLTSNVYFLKLLSLYTVLSEWFYNNNMNSNQINMISNNVNGIQSTKKRLKMIQYFKNKLLPQGILFLQETLCSESNEASWRDESNAFLFFSHGSSNFCRVLIGFLGQFNVNIFNQMCDNKGRILILNATIDAKNFNINDFLVTMDIEKAFDSLNHSFLLAVLKNFSFGTSFINLIEAILKKPKSCVINGGKTTQYFPLNRGARQGDPISPYLFILVMEVLFTLIKNNEKIQGLDILNYRFLYSAYADDSTFFLSSYVKNCLSFPFDKCSK